MINKLKKLPIIEFISIFAIIIFWYTIEFSCTVIYMVFEGIEEDMDTFWVGNLVNLFKNHLWIYIISIGFLTTIINLSTNTIFLKKIYKIKHSFIRFFGLCGLLYILSPAVIFSVASLLYQGYTTPNELINLSSSFLFSPVLIFILLYITWNIKKISQRLLKNIPNTLYTQLLPLIIISGIPAILKYINISLDINIYTLCITVAILYTALGGGHKLNKLVKSINNAPLIPTILCISGFAYTTKCFSETPLEIFIITIITISLILLFLRRPLFKRHIENQKLEKNFN